MKNLEMAVMIVLVAAFGNNFAHAQTEPSPSELPNWTVWECADATEIMPSLWISECKGASESVTKQFVYFITGDKIPTVIVWGIDPFIPDNPSLRTALRCNDNQWAIGAVGEKFRGIENSDSYLLRLRDARGGICERFFPKPKET